MAKRLVLTAVIALVFLPAALLAEVHLYLQSRVEISSECLRLKDVATVEGGEQDVSALEKSEFPAALYRDGYLDRREIKEFLGGITGEKFVIHGSAVRVERVKPAEEEKEAPALLVRNGRPVRFVAVKNGVRVELQGLAMKDGAAGDVVPVKLRKNKIARGIVRDAKTIELEL